MHQERHPIDTDRSERLLQAIASTTDAALFRYFGASVRGVERLPNGPALLVGNHSGGMSTPDTFLLCAAILRERGIDDIPFGLAHDTALAIPGLGELLRALGGVPASHDSAAALFERGRKVMVYPGGELDAFRPTRLRNQIGFGGRLGYAKLAIRHGVPVVPIVAAGAHSGFFVAGDLVSVLRRLGLAESLRLKTWPVTVSVPWGVVPGPCPPYLPLPTRILIEVLPPMEPPASESEVDVFDADLRERMQTALDRLVAERAEAGPWSIGSWRRTRSPATTTAS